MSSPESSKALASQPSPVRPPSVSAAPSPVASQYVSTKREDDHTLQQTTSLEWFQSRVVTPTKTAIQRVNAGPFMSTLREARSRLSFSSPSRIEAQEPSVEQDDNLEPLTSGSEGFPPADAPVTKGLAPPTHSGVSGANKQESAMPTFSVTQETKLNETKPPIADGSS